MQYAIELKVEWREETKTRVDDPLVYSRPANEAFGCRIRPFNTFCFFTIDQGLQSLLVPGVNAVTDPVLFPFSLGEGRMGAGSSVQ
jgi:hypothetical protein